MQSHATETNQNTMILFLFSIFDTKKSFSIVSPPTFHLAPRSLKYGPCLKTLTQITLEDDNELVEIREIFIKKLTSKSLTTTTNLP